MGEVRTGSRPMRRTLRAALGTMVAASAAPYGYTVTIWSSGAVLMHSHGTPNVGDVFLFIAGALTGFALLSLAAQGRWGAWNHWIMPATACSPGHCTGSRSEAPWGVSR